MLKMTTVVITTIRLVGLQKGLQKATSKQLNDNIYAVIQDK